jgi:hypothetical protein
VAKEMPWPSHSIRDGDEEVKRRRWEKFIKMCEDLRFGEVTLKVQDGIPQIAETIVRKVKFD